MKNRRLALGITLFLLPGCWLEQSSTPLVPDNPFGSPQVLTTPETVGFGPAAPTEAAGKVGIVGQKLLNANPQLGIQPAFRTVGAPQAEVFHRGALEILVTEGLVKQCKTEGELAAVLSVELGKIVSERQSMPLRRDPKEEHDPPSEVRVGNDGGGAFGPPDQTHLYELAKFDKEHRRAPLPSGPPADPHVLARAYLERAGYLPTELDAATPVLREAAKNVTLEKQMTTAPTVERPWVK
jgi:hypothetical protein